MTREQAKALLPIIQAYAEGKAIQYRPRIDEDGWRDSEELDLDLYPNRNSWRIKPEPREWWLVFKGTGVDVCVASPESCPEVSGLEIVHVGELLK